MTLELANVAVMTRLVFWGCSAQMSQRYRQTCERSSVIILGTASQIPGKYLHWVIPATFTILSFPSVNHPLRSEMSHKSSY
jgi:hypothetical protein